MRCISVFIDCLRNTQDEEMEDKEDEDIKEKRGEHYKGEIDGESTSSYVKMYNQENPPATDAINKDGEQSKQKRWKKVKETNEESFVADEVLHILRQQEKTKKITGDGVDGDVSTLKECMHSVLWRRVQNQTKVLPKEMEATDKMEGSNVREDNKNSPKEDALTKRRNAVHYVDIGAFRKAFADYLVLMNFAEIIC